MRDEPLALGFLDGICRCRKSVLHNIIITIIDRILHTPTTAQLQLKYTAVALTEFHGQSYLWRQYVLSTSVLRTPLLYVVAHLRQGGVRIKKLKLRP